jgi:hypothetical protein
LRWPLMFPRKAPRQMELAMDGQNNCPIRYQIDWDRFR